jgi:nucleotidyltransferase substrate binding protein (TIGR01987 family)
MTLERIKEIYLDYKKALERLKEALAEDISKGNIIIDGTIQRFEFTFELAWKLARAVLNYNGIEVEIPRLIIKEAFKAKLILDGEGWIDMLEDRNKTSHIYDEKEALKIYKKIKDSHFRLLQDFEKKIAKSYFSLKERKLEGQ